jgi:quercetin dioxygenase-like cupin family protein
MQLEQELELLTQTSHRKGLMMKGLKPNFAEAKPAAPANFVGEAYVQTLAPGDGSSDVEVLAVWFKNGARNKPHVHPTDQLLVGVEGTCVVATQHEHIHIDAGEMALVPKGEWHWHGAVKHTDACHLSIKKPGVTDWNQPLHNFND